MSDRDRDRVFMARCLELACAYRGKTAPNPVVGCVIVDKKGNVIAEGAHVAAGKDHGERAALRTLKDKAKGATLYVNLEPCNHQGRTPPCAPLVRDSGVARVVIGALDPIPGHGGGAALLKKAGIAVTTGVLNDACERANLGFYTHARLGRPAFTLKAAVTLDGKIATVGTESKWITSEAARADVLKMRGQHDAILIGAGTVLADDPRLTARTKGYKDPIRIVLDRMLRTPETAALLPRGEGPRTIIVASEGADPRAAERLEKAGAEVWRIADEEESPPTRVPLTDPPRNTTGRMAAVTTGRMPAMTGSAASMPTGRMPAMTGSAASMPTGRMPAVTGSAASMPTGRMRAITPVGTPALPTTEGGRSELAVLAERLGAEGIQSVLVEGGGETHAAFLAAGLADRIVLYVAPKLVGGPAKSWVGGPGVLRLADAYGFTFDEEIAFIGGDLRVALSAPRRDSH